MPPMWAISSQTVRQAESALTGDSPSQLLFSSADRRNWFILSHFELHPVASENTSQYM
jgi:hypothetical protein